MASGMSVCKNKMTQKAPHGNNIESHNVFSTLRYQRPRSPDVEKNSETKCAVTKGPIRSKIKHAVKLKTSPARLAQLLQPSLAFCFSLQPMTAHSCASLASFTACFILLVIAPYNERRVIFKPSLFIPASMHLRSLQARHWLRCTLSTAHVSGCPLDLQSYLRPRRTDR